jgi:ribosomal protein S12 methylthiotransferase accessory factor
MTVAVLGSGLLARAIVEAVPGGAARTTPLPAGCRFVVVARDGWDAGDGPDATTPWLPVWTEPGRVLIGPVTVPGRAGCVHCARLRQRLARRFPDGLAAVEAAQGERLRRPSALITDLAAGLVGDLVAAEAGRVVDGDARPRTDRAILCVDLLTLRISTHPFLPVPDCPACGGLPADSPVAARLELRPRPKPTPAEFRIPTPTTRLPALRGTFVDPVAGLVHQVHRDARGGIVVAGASVGHPTGGVETGHGRGRSYQHSERVAVLEALERYGGMSGTRTAVLASYRDVRDVAVDPRSLGVHAADAYRRPGFPFAPITDDRPYRWVWAHSFARDAPVLVPEAYAYYRVPRTGPGSAAPLYEVSNGCAIGGCLEEAVLFGLLEVAERDAFLLTWYARMPAPRVDLAADGDVAVLAAALRTETGYDVLVFDTTVEQRIPTVWAMAVDPGGDARRPRAVCAAGAHLDPGRAVASALAELGPILAHLVERYPRGRDRARLMVDDPGEVVAMEDHSLLYGDPDAFSRLAFLTGSPPTRTLAGMAATAGLPAHADLRDDVLTLVGRYLDSGLDVLVVDQTSPEHRAGGLSCVKVVVPGTLPMTFGHEYRRVDGLPRLHDVPYRLGHRDRPLRADEVNPHPHPFP